ncbi:PAS domain S-box protein [Variovorax saccharolyticus]|uniref:PAS domain S-box protein n=1 Tax=Variovorax saccharolyticus TaxID=3053516 RepID=UPI002578518D|nr:PAS domain S-box protein [Variovorax sp. J31P216]MDM0025425.1 PAS domain S-box protein [Variovorax sp. J31P216]
MASWFENLSLRRRIVLWTGAVMLGFAAVVASMLATEAQRIRNAAHEKVRILATASAADLQRVLDLYRSVLERPSARPLVQAMESGRCDPFIAESLRFAPAFLGYVVRDKQGNTLCAHDAGPLPSLPAADAAGFAASDLFVDERTGRKVVALGQAVRDPQAARVGQLVMIVDLLALNEQLFAGVPKNALVSVADRTRTVLLRSADPATFIGSRPSPGDADPVAGAREGSFSAPGRDGVPRLFALLTLPGADWRVAAGLPEADVFSGYHDALWRTLGFGVGLCLILFVLAWRLSAGIADPIARLERVAVQIAAGRHAVRAEVDGPPEIRAVAQQINKMLDARAVSEARLRGIFESAVDAILTANDRQIIVEANPAAARMFRCPLDDLVGSPLSRLLPERLREDYARDVAAFAADPLSEPRMGRQQELVGLRADGVEFPVEGAISRLTIAGHPLFTVILRDVTERRQAEEELRAGASKLQAALSSMSDAVCISDTEGRLVDFNDAFATFHRFPDKSACRRSVADYPDILDVRAPDGTPVPLRQWPVYRALRGETATNVEYRLRRKDTGDQWIGSCSFAPICAGDGAIVGAVVTSRDVTAVRQVQEELEKSHVAMQRLSASRDQVQEEERKRIARELHDDLQQTLAAIRMDLRVIGERFGAREPDLLAHVAQVDGLAERVVASTRRIVNDLRPPMLEDLGLVPALELLVAEFGQRTRVACVLDAPEEASEALLATPALALCLYRVVQEALNNVAKHAQASEAQVRIALEPAVSVSVRISDNGLGLGAADRRKPDAFGILGIQERVRIHGGSLRIDAAPGGGTVLDVRIPLAGATAAASPTQQTLQDVIDALAGIVAVVDRRGVIRFVNRAWSEFAEHNGQPAAVDIGPGANYLEVCRRSAISDASALHVLRGLDEVMRGSRKVFTCEYPCHSPDERRWFQMHATLMATGEILVAHFLVSRESHAHLVIGSDGTRMPPLRWSAAPH